jgi:hypothetical protein
MGQGEELDREAILDWRFWILGWRFWIAEPRVCEAFF